MTPNDQEKPTPRIPYDRKKLDFLANAEVWRNESEETEHWKHPGFDYEAEVIICIEHEISKELLAILPSGVRSAVEGIHKRHLFKLGQFYQGTNPKREVSMSYHPEERGYHRFSLREKDELAPLHKETEIEMRLYYKARIRKVLKDYASLVIEKVFAESLYTKLKELSHVPFESCLLYDSIKAPQGLQIFQTINIIGLDRREILITAEFQDAADKRRFEQFLQSFTNPPHPLSSVKVINGTRNEECGYCRILPEDLEKAMKLWKQLTSPKKVSHNKDREESGRFQAVH